MTERHQLHMNTIIEGEHTDAKVMLPTDKLEEGVVDQIQTLVDHEAFQNEVRIMPDCHVGAGAVIGFTMPLGERVVPNTIGVDIGCGMLAANFGEFDWDEEDLRTWDEEIRKEVPMGFEVYDDQDYHLGEDFPWVRTNHKLLSFEDQYGTLSGASINYKSPYDLDYFKDLCDRVGYDQTRAINSVGTLGGGNHFIELGESSTTGLWCIIHSGSRGIGLQIAQHHQERAVGLRSAEKFRKDVLPERYQEYATDNLKPKAEKIREDFEGTDIGQVFDAISEARGKAVEQFDEDLAYLEGSEAHQYFVDMIFAQMYASESRKLMMQKVGDVLDRIVRSPVESVHNFIDFEDLTIRKGATRAGREEVGVVPLNMRDGTLLVEGKGNDEWNNSAPHGAGRAMSRTQAFDELSVEDFEAEMDGIESSSVNGETLDEAPGAYKSPNLIERAIEPTAEIVDWTKPVLNLKAE